MQKIVSACLLLVCFFQGHRGNVFKFSQTYTGINRARNRRGLQVKTSTTSIHDHVLCDVIKVRRHKILETCAVPSSKGTGFQLTAL
ncbi:hypothetical protein BD769DRAFT_1438606 [Suillus cothurnatus]|nr:hypothetical protein BD769DRAFT_1438606 [Suillus cothurnatus]